MRVVSCYLLACAAVCTGCDEKARVAEPQRQPQASAQQPASRAPSSRALDVRARLASPTAFELIATLDGAKLVWSAPGKPYKLFEQAIAKNGQLRGGGVELGTVAPLGRVTDLVAAQLDRGVAVAWVEQSVGAARARALVSDGRFVRQIVELGAAWRIAAGTRDNIALAGAHDYALVFFRGTQEPCTEGESECFGFGLYRLEPGGVATARGLPLSVPVPCGENSTLLTIVEGRWHYGVCTLAGAAPVTTLFNIQFEPEYAAAEQLLERCDPLGLFEHDGDVWLSGNCSGKRSAVRATGKQRSVYDLSGLVFECSASGPRLIGGDFELRLGAPRAGMHTLLGPPWVSGPARAVWTGGALVVATEQEGNVRLVRYACE